MVGAAGRTGEGAPRVRAVRLVAGGLVLATAMLLVAAAGPGQERVERLVGFVGDPGPAEVALIERAGGQVRQEIGGIPVVLAELPAAAADALERNPRVDYVEPNRELRALDHTQASLPWGVERIGTHEAWQTGIDADAWQEAASAGDGVTVAVLDSGISHEYAFDEDVPCTDIAEGAGCEDLYHHGTHVAGTITASHASQTPGIADGVALHNVKVLGDDGVGSTAEVAVGLHAAVSPENSAQPADVINMSLGGGGSETLASAVRAAAEEGALLVAAAGNGGNRGGNNDTVSYPAAYDEVIAVAATDHDDERAVWSSTGPAVEIAAPGVAIPSTWPEQGDSDLDGDYHDGSGTSMASPHVAGAAALAIAADADASADEVRDWLTATAEPLDDAAHRVGAGLVDAGALVARALHGDGATQPDEPVGHLAGTVTDADSTDPLQGVTVTVKGGPDDSVEESAQTGEDGGYRFEDVLAGTYTVTADADGYESAVESGVVIEENETTLLDLSLEATEATEGDVTVKQVSYETRGGRQSDRHLDTTVALVDGGGEPLGGVAVEFTITRDDGEAWTFGEDTGSDGTVTVTLTNHGTGCYETAVDSVGADWDGAVPDNEYCNEG